MSISGDSQSIGAHLLAGSQCSPGLGRAAGTTGQGSGRCCKGDEKLIKVTVLYSELGCADLSLRSNNLQRPWASNQQFDTLLSLGQH